MSTPLGHVTEKQVRDCEKTSRDLVEPLAKQHAKEQALGKLYSDCQNQLVQDQQTLNEQREQLKAHKSKSDSSSNFIVGSVVCGLFAGLIAGSK